jgi:hypothetical protein
MDCMSPISKSLVQGLILTAAIVSTSTAACGQVELQLRVKQLPGWDARTREGRCEIRVWVDNRAEVRMRGDAIFVRTLEGSKGLDEGSECSQPLPYNSVRGFQIHQTAGRNRVSLTQEPSRMNNYTALMAIDDPQGGGDNYAFEVSWQAEPDVATAPAPFFDDIRACQDTVRARFQSQNGRGSYIDFNNFADRTGRPKAKEKAMAMAMAMVAIRSNTKARAGTGGRRRSRAAAARAVGTNPKI